MTMHVVIALVLLSFAQGQSAPPPTGSSASSSQQQAQPKKAPKKPPINPADTGGARGMGLLLRGTVVDPAEAAVTAAAIRLTTNDGATHWETASDASGRFEFRVPQAGLYVLEISKPGFRTTWQPGLKLDSLLCSVKSRLEPGSGEPLVVPFVELRGRVRDSAGDPVADAQLEFSRAGSAKPVVVAADSDGEFRVSNFQSGSYDVRISAPGFQPREERGMEIKASARPVSLSFELRK